MVRTRTRMRTQMKVRMWMTLKKRGSNVGTQLSGAQVSGGANVGGSNVGVPSSDIMNHLVTTEIFDLDTLCKEMSYEK